MTDSISRRDFVRRSAGWTVLLCASPWGVRRSLAGDPPPDLQSPIDLAPAFGRTRKPGRLPFAEGFLGDSFARPHAALVNRDALLAKLPGGKPPEPSEKADVVVVGGGLAGLSSAWLLRDRKPILLEQAPRLGGNSKGERWRESVYALGGAYFIQPDEGDELEALYREIGAMEGTRKLEGHDPVEYRGKLYAKFFEGESSPEDAAAFETYVARMKAHEEEYPEIPIPGEEERELVVGLDRRSLADVVTEWLGGKVPPALQAALQNYCWSSLGAGWREISAAAGINFLAGEAFGVLAHPGGNAGLAVALLRNLREAVGAANLRTGCIVFDVKATETGVRVAYLDPDDRAHTLEAKAAVLACPKFAVKTILQGIEPERLKAIEQLQYRGYLVVNVLVDAPVDHDFYDLYLLRDGTIVETPTGEGKAPGRITDVILGNWARGADRPKQSVLTLYWPLPFESGRADVLLRKDSWEYLQPLAERQILEILPLLGLKAESVIEVRMARWGHALPVAKPNFIADGHAEAIRRPHAGKVFFVNQDNWALPAVETAFLEAIHFAPEVRAAAGAG